MMILYKKWGEVMKIRILLVEDELQLGRNLQRFLLQYYDEVIWVNTYEKAIEHIAASFDLYLLDIHLKDGNGLDLCKEIRAVNHEPIIFLTVYDEEKTILNSYALGCDDYICKPFSPAVLVARINAVLKRSKKHINKLCCHQLILDLNLNKCFIDQQDIKLTPIEFKIMVMLLRNSGQTIPRERFLEEIWDRRGNYIEDNTLTVNISMIKRKLLDYAAYLETTRSIGYRWSGEVTEIEE